MIEIICLSCGITGKISLDQQVYDGPYRCWKCQRIFHVKTKDNEVKLIEPISQGEFEKWQERQRIEKWRLSNKREGD
jgi:hypothetical protein